MGINMLKQLESKFNNIPIKKKILFLFLFGILIPIVVLVTFSMYQLQSELSNREKILVEGELSRIKMNLNTTVNTACNLASTYFLDKELAWALQTYSDASKDSLEVIRKIDSQILSNRVIHPFIQQINLYYENPDLFETSYTHLIQSEIKELDWYKDYMNSQQNPYIGLQFQGSTPNIYIIQKLNLLHFHNNAFIKIDLSSRIITSYLDSELLTKENSSIYLVNPENQIVISNISDAPKMFFSISIDSDSSMYETAFDDNSFLNGWEIVVVSKEDILYPVMTKNIGFLAFMFSIILIISLLLFSGLAHSIINRLEFMVKVMKRSNNDIFSVINIDMGFDEIGITAKQYNSMIQRICHLLEENTEAYDELQITNEELLASLEDNEKQEQQIYELIYIDKLTGLDNRYAITNYIDNKLRDIKDNETFSVSFLDVDNFKLINDTYGHDFGDDIISQLGSRLKFFVSDSIHIGRFGGDEFIITVSGYDDIPHLYSIYEDVRIAMKDTILINGISIILTISMGVSLYAIHSTNRHELIKLADIALYEAKELGRDNIVLFEDSMKQYLFNKLEKQALIRDAIKNNQFILYYQPYFDLVTEEMKGCEALIRWKKECNLQMSPQELIHHIEEMGLMVEFGDWIFIEACLFAKRINANRTNPIVVSINISTIQLMQSNFVENILYMIKTHQIDMNHICLEMTETILMSSIEKGSFLLKQLHKSGISISLDDFGTGYSSLKYFKELPIATLKIDKSFIDQIIENEYDKQLVDTMIQLAHNKKVQVIAEGVETKEQIILLQAMGCDIIQGYYFSKPMGEEEITNRILQTGDK